MVAMATNRLHRLIMGKVEIEFFSVLMGIYFFLFYRNVYRVVFYLS